MEYTKQRGMDWLNGKWNTPNVGVYSVALCADKHSSS